MDVFTRIDGVKSKAYKGAAGAMRERFCKEYSKALRQIFANIQRNAKLSLKDGENISCRKGCSHCCRQHVGVPFAQGLLVVDYLYSHKPALSNFVNNYARWYENAGSISENIDFELRSSMRNPDSDDLLRHVKNPLLQKYLVTQTPCPFLKNEVCSIYEARPFNCAQHLSISPNEWCAIESTTKPKTKEIRLTEGDRENLRSLPYVSPGLFFIFTLPVLTYKLMVNGLPYFLNEMEIEPLFV